MNKEILIKSFIAYDEYGDKIAGGNLDRICDSNAEVEQLRKHLKETFKAKDVFFRKITLDKS